MNMEVRSDSEQCAKSVDSTVMDVDKASADDQLVPNGNEIELENDCDSGTEENGHEDDGEQAEANRPVRMNKEQRLILDLRTQIPEIDRLFNIHRRIGEGTFSSVFMASVLWHDKRPMELRRVYAIKHLIPTTHPRRIAQELICLKEIGNPLYNVSGVNLCLRNGDSVAFVMPYISHIRFADFFDQMNTSELQEYMRNLLIALRHVHSFKVIHRDIKPSNFLYDRGQRKYLLVDFGLAQILDKDMLSTNYKALSTTNTVNEEKKEEEEQGDAAERNSTEYAIDADDAKLSAKLAAHNDENNEVRAKRRASDCNDIENQSAAGESNPAKRHCGPNARQTAAQHQNEAAAMQQPEPQTPTFNIPFQPHKTPLQQINEISNQRRHNELNSAVSADVKSAVLSVSMNKKIEHLRNNQTPNNKASPQSRNNDATPTTSAGHKYNLDNRLSGKNAKCLCYARNSVCNICLIKPEINATRAGTPGYRPTEVLVKYPNQTTAVDMWAAGVILISILSRCYPFFQGSNDFVALAEIIAIFGLTEVKSAAHSLGRHLVCNLDGKPSHLRKLCIRLRRRHEIKLRDQLEKEEEQKRQQQQQKQNNTPNNDNNTSSTKQKEKCAVCEQPLASCLCLNSAYNTDFSNDCYPDSVYDLLKKLLAVHPKDRISAADALEHPFFQENFH